MKVEKLFLDGEWLELEAVNKNVGKLRFKVKPMSASEQFDFASGVTEDPKESLIKIEELIIDWELEENGKKLECNEANKKKYIPYLITVVIKDEESKLGNTVGRFILEFAQDFSNFVKN